jgi:ABC-type multidrug transport system ATPase subunit/ABC-type multidrug transport system permease subunit
MSTAGLNLYGSKIVPLQRNDGADNEIMSFVVEKTPDNELVPTPVQVGKKEVDAANGELGVDYLETEKARILPLATSARKIHNTKADMELSWKDIRIIAKPKAKGFCKKQITEEKVLLNNVNGRVKSGEALAIIGASGAGKTTLLNFLSRKIQATSLKITGEVTLNSMPIEDEKFMAIASYVMQDDILEPMMSPQEILIFTATMKLMIPKQEIDKKVKNMISDLHLTKCQNTRVGNNMMRGVSGGERKRTSIGVELISDPKIVFLDEPTTGLDSYNAYEVIQLLRTLAEKGKIIIFTIHQPSSEIYQLLDKLCILALGQTVYFGPQESCYDHFEKCKIPVPLNYNPFEHFIEKTNIMAIGEKSIRDLVPEIQEDMEKQKQYEKYIQYLNGIYERNKADYVDDSPPVTGFDQSLLEMVKDHSQNRGFCFEFFLLFGRGMVVTMRNPKLLAGKIAQIAITGAIIAILFVNVTKNFSGIQDRMGLLLLMFLNIIFGASTTNILIFADERKVFLRERSNRLYKVISYYVAKMFYEVPAMIIGTNVFVCIIYWSTELNDTYSWIYYAVVGILYLCGLAGSALAFFIGTLVSHQEALVNLNTMLMIPMLLLSGFFANADNYAPYLIPFKYLSPFKYAYQTAISLEFNNLQPLNCMNSNPNLCDPLPNQFFFLEPFWLSIVLLSAIIVFFKFWGFIFLYKFGKIKV